MKINTIIEVLNYLSFDYQIKHENDYSEIIIPTNNQLRDRNLLFECGEDGKVYSNDFVDIEKED